MSEKRDLLQPETTLAELGIQLMFTELLQHKPKVFFMFFLTSREYQNIINEYHNKLIKILHEYLVHQVHEVRWSVGQAKNITVNSYNPCLDVNVVFGISSTRIFN
jgi:hypothetical protein